MGSAFGPLHVLLVAGIFGTLWCLFRIIERAGFNRAWGLLVFVPGVNWIALWVFAYAKWPALEKSSSATSQAAGSSI